MIRRAAMWLAVVMILGCASPIPEVPPPPPEQEAPPPAPREESPEPLPREERPALPGQEQKQSEVTWTVASLDEPWIRSPFTVTATLPHRFRFTFSAPVSRVSVSGAITRKLPGYSIAFQWVDERTVDVSINSGPQTASWSFLTLTAADGKDAGGATLPALYEGTVLLALGKNTTVWRWERGKDPEPAAELGGPFDVLSVSPDGQRLALRRFGMRQSGGFPPVGPPPGFAYWYHVPSGRLERLEGVSMWLSPQWLPDGSLLVSGSADGTGLMHVNPDGDQTRLVEGRRVVDYAVDRSARHVAVFLANGQGQAGDIWLFDLHTGQREEFAGAFTPAGSPNGVPQVTALWSPDAALLAYTDRTGKSSDSGGPDRVVTLDRATGDRRTLVEDAGAPESWAPDGTYLFVRGAGIVATADGTLALPAPGHGTGAFSPVGDRVFIEGLGILSAPGWETLVELASYYRHAAWSPDGAHLLLTGGDGPASLYTSGGLLVSTAPADILADLEEDPAWSPEGRFVVLNEDWLLDTERLQYQELQPDRGVPVGWSRGGYLYLANGRGFGDGLYVKPTVFGR